MKNQATFSGKKWAAAPELEKIEDIKQVLLERRGLTSRNEIETFLRPSLRDTLDPFEMAGMEKAVQAILASIDKGERIMIFGDFDADGITSTVILVEGIEKLGGEVSFRIPDRNVDSHGLKNYFLDEIASKKTKLLITCDCGINDKIQVEYAVSLGMKVIITDHHESDEAFFPSGAEAVLNPRQRGCHYREKNLSGAGIAFKLVSALAAVRLPSEEIADFLDPLLEVCAIGLVADCVEMAGENRILAKFGLEKLKSTNWMGLREILDGEDARNINEETIQFLVAPKLNAASRIGDVLVAANLFLGKKSKHHSRLRILDGWNAERKVLTQQAFEESESQIDLKNRVQILFKKEWKPGILGLLASRWSEKLNQPAIAACERKDGLIAASARAGEGFSIFEALGAADQILGQKAKWHFGGHHAAAGFLVESKYFGELSEILRAHFASVPTPEPKIEPDCFLTNTLLNSELAEFLSFLRPFGSGNPTPIFGVKNFKISGFRPIGKEKNHAKIWGTLDEKPLECCFFFHADLFEFLVPNQTFDFLFTFSQNFWKEKSRLQLRAIDFRRSFLKK